MDFTKLIMKSNSKIPASTQLNNIRLFTFRTMFFEMLGLGAMTYYCYKRSKNETAQAMDAEMYKRLEKEPCCECEVVCFIIMHISTLIFGVFPHVFPFVRKNFLLITTMLNYLICAIFTAYGAYEFYTKDFEHSQITACCKNFSFGLCWKWCALLLILFITFIHRIIGSVLAYKAYSREKGGMIKFD